MRTVLADRPEVGTDRRASAMRATAEDITIRREVNHSNWLRTETSTVLVHNFAVGLNRNRHNVFLSFNGIFVFPLAVKKLPQPRHLIIHNLLLRLQLGFKHNVTVLIANQRHWPLAECVDVNTKAG